MVKGWRKALIALLCLVMMLAVVPTSTNAVNYYSVPINSYDAFRNATAGNGYDIDGSWGWQCWDGVALFWQQLGMWLYTGSNSYAKECWTASRDRNAGDQFDLIYNIADVKRGDVIVFMYWSKKDDYSEKK